MIRFLQADNRVVKALFVVIIGVASVSMVVYLIPGLMSGGSTGSDTYAVVYPHWYSRFLGSGDEISEQKVQDMTRRQVMQRNPQYADNPMILKFFEAQVAQQMIQQQVLLQEARHLGITATDADVLHFLQYGPYKQVFFPGGKFIGETAYSQIINDRANTSVAQFEQDLKESIMIQRLQAMVTANVTVSDKDVREEYRKQNLKIKFDYAVVSSTDLEKTINPSDSELEAFFKKNAARYATAVPESRKITYFAFTPGDVPGGLPQPTNQQIEAYYNQHQSEFQVPKQARSRHILIKVAPGADAKTDAAAKAKAEDVLKQLQAGGDWKALAKKYSDDPGSKDSGGELGFAKPGTMVPEFDNAIFNQKIGDIKIVKSQFGYHVVQVEERQDAHAQALNEVLPQIQATLFRQASEQAQENYARTLTSEADRNGLEKTAAAHHLQVVTSPPVPRTGVISALASSAQLLSKAFDAKVGDPPQYAPTGEGYAIFQVTGIVAAHAPDFADWKSHVLDDYRHEQLPALLNKKTQELADKAKQYNDLNKAAKEVGATVKTSDPVNETGQVPDIGDVGQVAPQLFDLSVGAISGPIDADRNGIVAKIVDRQQPTPDEIQKNFDATREQILGQRQSQAFEVFMGSLMDQYKRNNLIRVNAKNAEQSQPGM
ncbi:MAG TPA: peptidylprolyl isomerase [Terracidiphilus sp.]|nr:peptidylprolyl isomerase [Terracidiphilus sp.]